MNCSSFSRELSESDALPISKLLDSIEVLGYLADNKVVSCNMIQSIDL